jgi:hypothetical protein
VDTPRDPILATAHRVDSLTDEERAPDMPTRHNSDGSILLPTPAAIFAAADRAAEEAASARAAAIRASDQSLACSDQIGGMLGELARFRRSVDTRLLTVDGKLDAIGDMMRRMSVQQGLPPAHPPVPPPREKYVSEADLDVKLDEREERRIGKQFRTWKNDFAKAVVVGLAGVVVAGASTCAGWGLHELRHPQISNPTQGQHHE